MPFKSRFRPETTSFNFQVHFAIGDDPYFEPSGVTCKLYFRIEEETGGAGISSQFEFGQNVAFRSYSYFGARPPLRFQPVAAYL